ncbi:MAG: response regulator [Cyclobacteriaceae bacterium]
MKALYPCNETDRIKNLRSYEILDSSRDSSFDNIATLASQVSDCPIALISLVDVDRQWFKSTVGIELNETQRSISFCAHTILTPEKPLIITDTQKDERFQKSPLVCGAPNIRFYAGFPIVTEEGYCIGTLCVIDQKPRKINGNKKKMLHLLSTQITNLLTLHRKKNNLNVLSKIVNQSNNMIVVFDNKYNYEYANPMFVKRSGYTLKEIIGKNAMDILIGSETDMKDIEALLISAHESQEEKEKEICLQPKSGESFWVKIAFKMVYDEHHRVRKHIGILMDINEFKIKQQQLIQAKEEAQEGARMKEQFLSNMSHEIRTPMNGIIGLSNILLEDHSLSTKDMKLVSHINYSAESLLRILNDILDYSKINAEKLTFENINFDLIKVFDELKGSFGLIAKEKGLDFQVKIDKKIPKFVAGDPTRMNQILRNIVGNAVKFTELGGIYIQVDLIEYNMEGPVLEVCVSDTGIGIPKSQLKTIFNEFEQGRDYISSKYGGTGLGMSIANRLVERFGGILSVSSQEGVGTDCKFSLQLNNPIIDTGQKETYIDLENDILKNKTIKVLVADDNDMNQIVTQDSLEKIGCQVQIAENGKECVDLFIKGNYDLILMDVQMPIMNGLDATRAIRLLDSDIPILAMTASVMEHDKIKCLEAGMNQIIAKPIKTRELNAIISEYLRTGKKYQWSK